MPVQNTFEECLRATGTPVIVTCKEFDISIFRRLCRLSKYSNLKMTYLKSWEEFEKAAEKLYLQEPTRVRYSMKYVHSKNVVILKVTDDVVVLQFRTEIAQDLRKIDKFVSNLMRHMVSKEH